MKRISDQEVLGMMSNILNINVDDISRVMRCWRLLVGHYLSSMDDFSISLPEVMRIRLCYGERHRGIVPEYYLNESTKDEWNNALKTYESPLVNYALDKVENDIISDLTKKSLI